jgi:hypothetical protein
MYMIVIHETPWRIRRGINRLAAAVAASLLTAAVLTGCNVHPGGHLSGSSSCADYIKASAQDEARLVEDLYHSSHPSEPAAGPASANAVFNVAYECQQQPDRHVGDLADFR